MWNVQLKPEFRKELRDPDRFVKGMGNVFAGVMIAMCGVLTMLFLYFYDPKNVLAPSVLMVIGLGMAGWGEWQKHKAK
jgi:hypothetical protein